MFRASFVPAIGLLQMRSWGSGPVQNLELQYEFLVLWTKTLKHRVQWFARKGAWVGDQGSELGSSCSFYDKMLPRKIKQTTADYFTGKYDLGWGGWKRGWSEEKWFGPNSVAVGTWLWVAERVLQMWHSAVGPQGLEREVNVRKLALLAVFVIHNPSPPLLPPPQTHFRNPVPFFLPLTLVAEISLSIIKPGVVKFIL